MTRPSADKPGPTVEFTLAPGVAPATADGNGAPVLHSHELGGGDWQIERGLPVTTPARTMADIVATGTADTRDVRRLVGTVLRRGLASKDVLTAALAANAPSGDGRELLTALLTSSDTNS